MKDILFPFQRKALNRLRMSTATALGNYHDTLTPQIVSYTAPTGAGKTVVMTALIESILYGDDNYPDQTDAVFVWLSDSPQLNEQSKNKIDLRADKIRLGQCVTVTDDSFDQEVFDDGHIYFINTQKLGKSSNLTIHADGRQYTIWETLANTVREKSDRLYFIIDEAHRGAQKKTELARATTIMQKFLIGSPEDGLPPMPVVIGMTATSKRFQRLAENIQSTTHYVTTTPDEVRASGLLKDRIVVTYPETANNDMAVLQAATDEWVDKWNHWEQYCRELHYAYVNPVFVIQVQNGSNTTISYTDLDECLRIIEERSGERFSEGQVVHAFGDTKDVVVINGLDVHYCEPSRIADDKRIKLVFFKEALSTGWDCPRAEAMMSFRRRTDATYIAQLLGRMVRTPTQQHINVDETLNDVHLFLPQFDEKTVNEVIGALQSAEGADIPVCIETELLGNGGGQTLGLKPTFTKPQHRSNVIPGQGEFSPDGSVQINGPKGITTTQTSGTSTITGSPASATSGTQTITPTQGTETAKVNPTPVETPVEEKPETEKKNEGTKTEVIEKPIEDLFDREAVVKAINKAGLLTYHVRKIRNSDYLKSMYALAHFLTRYRLDMDAMSTIISDVVTMISNQIETLKKNGEYDNLASQVKQFKLNTHTFDVFGKSINTHEDTDFYATTDLDLDRQFRLAETKLGNEGIGNAYCNRYSSSISLVDCKIHVIIFAATDKCMASLQSYAESKFHELNDNHRRGTATLPEKYKKQYDDIVSDGDAISKHSFRLPETIRAPYDEDGREYRRHLFVNDMGYATIKLNGWEQKTIEEEEKRDDFVCWIRNPARGSWALCIPYESDGEYKAHYPDFLVVREDEYGYVVDILEPHLPASYDNLGKARGLAEYARQHSEVGRIQLIRVEKDASGNERPYRLDMSKSAVRDKVLYCASMEELNNIFRDYGYFE